MTQRRELEAHLALYGDLSGILGAMRSFALAELRRVTQRESAQQQTAAALASAYAAMAPALPEPEPAVSDAWLLFGSVRGFCASFNEDVLRLWSEQGGKSMATVAVGERLHAMMPGHAATIVVPGAIGSGDAAAAIDRILAALPPMEPGVGLVACYRDDGGARVHRLLPLENGRRDAELPLTYEPAARVAAGVARHFLFHRMLSLLLRALRVENHMRLVQMENALQHIERASDGLQRDRNRLRQGEIVEEIELILRDRKGDDTLSPDA